MFGLSYGYEHPLWYAPQGMEAVETYGFERQNWFEPVAEECGALREAVGIIVYRTLPSTEFAALVLRIISTAWWRTTCRRKSVAPA